MTSGFELSTSSRSRPTTSTTPCESRRARRSRKCLDDVLDRRRTRGAPDRAVAIVTGPCRGRWGRPLRVGGAAAPRQASLRMIFSAPGASMTMRTRRAPTCFSVRTIGPCANASRSVSDGSMPSSGSIVIDSFSFRDTTSIQCSPVEGIHPSVRRKALQNSARKRGPRHKIDSSLRNASNCVSTHVNSDWTVVRPRRRRVSRREPSQLSAWRPCRLGGQAVERSAFRSL